MSRDTSTQMTSCNERIFLQEYHRELAAGDQGANNRTAHAYVKRTRLADAYTGPSQGPINTHTYTYIFIHTITHHTLYIITHKHLHLHTHTY